MCGIAGILQASPSIDAVACLQSMLQATSHRGPDHRGIWSSSDRRVTFGHNRLAILDLTSDGHQPMHSECGRYVITYNGEVYNYLELKKELIDLGHRFRGNSDTEVILASIVEWGLTASVKRFNGMFAFALWDGKKELLYLVRDRIGVKPLYYGLSHGSFLFGSELKALRAFPGFSHQINANALGSYFRYNYIPVPCTIYDDIYKLPPAHILEISPQQLQTPTLDPYWSMSDVVSQPKEVLMEKEALLSLDSLLKDAIGKCMISDVPLGSFLSGGIDSSLVTSLMQAQSQKPIRTFSIGFAEKSYDEGSQAAAVARYLKTEHTELLLAPEEAMAVIPELANIYDEPFADSSQIPTYLVSRLARQSVTVCLSGDGGDEAFGGYNRHFFGKSLWGKTRFMPEALRNLATKGIFAISPSAWDKILSPIQRYTRSPGDHLHKFARAMGANTVPDFYESLITHQNPASVLRLPPRDYPIAKNSTQDSSRDISELMMYLDTIGYLHDDVLTKVDRASMRTSLEARVPLLDHRVIEFAWRLPISYRVRGAQGKWLLRQLLYRYVPQQLVDRPKTGFAVPIGAWLKGPLRPWTEGLLDEKRMKEQGYLNPAPIQKKWKEHLSGQYNWQQALWGVLMFQSWLEANAT